MMEMVAVTLTMFMSMTRTVLGLLEFKEQRSLALLQTAPGEQI